MRKKSGGRAGRLRWLGQCLYTYPEQSEFAHAPSPTYTEAFRSGVNGSNTAGVAPCSAGSWGPSRP
jgi:hypothetical protein